MKLKEITVVIWTLTMHLLRIILKGWQKLREKIGTGLMTTSGTVRSSGTDGVILISLDNVEHPTSYTKEISHDGTIKVHTHTTGSLSKISSEPQRISSTLKPGDTWSATYPESSIYDINLIFTPYGLRLQEEQSDILTEGCKDAEQNSYSENK